MRYFALGSLALTLLTGATNIDNPPSIRGTYQLVSRDLADGTKQVPPNIVGMITFTAKYRNFNIYWKGPNGKPVSISKIARYQLTGKEYRETNVYFSINDEAGGKGISYELSETSGSSPVMTKGTRIHIKPPLNDEPSLVFDGNKMTATREGVFVDHWVRVE
jgi:hypothetical protein